MTPSETALIFGTGPGLGAALARTFAAAGIAVAVAARRAVALDPIVAEVAAAGGMARAFVGDVTDEAEVAAVFDAVTAAFAPPRLVVYNAGMFVPASILDIAPEDFERCWRVGCFGGFLVGREAARRMLEHAESGDTGTAGTILFTGATASLRGGARFANLAVGKFGLRALAQSMARELGPRGLHVGHVIIDGQIARAGAGGDDDRLDPDAIAATYLMLHRQHRSAWTQELDLRPWVERF